MDEPDELTAGTLNCEECCGTGVVWEGSVVVPCPECGNGDSRLAWLNGWERMGGPDGTSVLIGTGVHCVGCGAFHGLTCVVFPEDYAPPVAKPDWPFPEDHCPVCMLSSKLMKLQAHEPDWPKGKPRPLP